MFLSLCSPLWLQVLALWVLFTFKVSFPWWSSAVILVRSFNMFTFLLFLDLPALLFESHISFFVLLAVFVISTGLIVFSVSNLLGDALTVFWRPT